MMRSNTLVIGIIIGIQAAFSVSDASYRQYCINNEQKQIAVTFVADYLKMDRLFQVYKTTDPNYESSVDPSSESQR